ncbi:MAG: hypothetical protein ABSG74_02690 [Candidatus Bathyarchaeia archaeon]|jgi:hypothetical protein
MTRVSKKILIPLVIILLVMATPLAICASKTSTRDLVVNGSFEDGMRGWELGPPPLAQGGVEIVTTISRNGSHSLRLIGGGVGFLQKLDPRSIFPSMQLSFRTLLSPIAGEKEPQALFHLYFLPIRNGPTYYVDITVTPDNAEDLAAVFEPNPGVDIGGIYLRFNREPQNAWIPISVDISKLMERYLPDFFDPHVNRIMLESAEGGEVYFDDISLNSTNHNYDYGQTISLAWHYILYSTAGRIISQLLGYSVLLTAFASVYHWLRSRGRGLGSRRYDGIPHTSMICVTLRFIVPSD